MDSVSFKSLIVISWFRFVNDLGNSRIQVFDFNQQSGRTLQPTISDCVSLSFIRPNLLLVNTDEKIYLFNTTGQYITCAVGCDPSVPELDRIHDALLVNNTDLIVSDSHRIVRIPHYQQCFVDGELSFPTLDRMHCMSMGT